MVYMISSKYRSTYNEDIDRIPFWMLAAPMLFWSCVIHPSLNDSYFGDVQSYLLNIRILDLLDFLLVLGSCCYVPPIIHVCQESKKNRLWIDKLGRRSWFCDISFCCQSSIVQNFSLIFLVCLVFRTQCCSWKSILLGKFFLRIGPENCSLKAMLGISFLEPNCYKWFYSVISCTNMWRGES